MRFVSTFLAALFTIFWAAAAFSDNLTSLGLRDDGVTAWRLQNDTSATQDVTLGRYGGGFEEIFSVPPGRTVVFGGDPGTYIAQFATSGSTNTKASGPQPFDACYHLGQCIDVEIKSGVATPIKATIGQTILLDPTAGLDLLDGKTLRADWVWSDRPATSVAAFSDPAALRPMVIIDVAGTYLARVNFYDASASSAVAPLYAATVEISTENLHPIAKIVGRSTPGVDAPFILDGSDSFDVDGDLLTYAWAVVEEPSVGSAMIADPSAPLTAVSFADFGQYQITLSVQDSTGRVSEPATYLIDFAGDTAAALSLGETLGTFNLVTNALTSTQTVQGRSYIGSTMTGVSGQFGTNLPNDGANFATLSIDGDLQNSNINLVQGAEARITGLRVQSNVNNGVLIEGVTDLPIFDFEEFKATSAFLAGLTGSAPNLSDQNHKRFGGAANIDPTQAVFGPRTRVVTTSMQDLLTGGYSVDVSNVDTVIINVSGTTGTFQINPLGGTAWAPKVIWNFFEATSLNINSVVAGHILAPHAELRGFSGGSEGSVIAQSVQLSNGPLRQRAWLGDVPTSDDGVRRNVAPRAALFFAQMLGEGSFTASAHDSTDLDADPLSPSFDIVFGPDVSLTSEEGFASIDLSGQDDDLLLSLRVNDGLMADGDVLLIAPAGGAVRPKAMISSPVVGVGGSITLDGTQSYDLNGDLLTYEWALIARPSGSASTLNATTPFAEFTADVDGTYIAQLTVSDDIAASVPATVIIQTPVGLPTANAGPDALASIGGVGFVDAGLSVADQPSYLWSPTNITGASGLLGTPTSVGTDVTLEDDNAGGFLSSAVQLFVTDTQGIARPTTVLVSDGNLRPIVNRGTEVAAQSGAAVTLNASSYVNDPNADLLSFTWSLLSRPAGSSAAIDPSAPDVTRVSSDQLIFTADVSGLYLVQLVAQDAQLVSRPAVLIVRVENSPPTAVVGTLSEAFVGETVVLDGTASFDPDGNAISYLWSVTNRPTGSTASISNATGAAPSFTPDVKGTYTFALVVSDFELSSAVATTTLTVPNRAPELVVNGPDSAILGEVGVFDASNSFDPDGDELAFSIEVFAPAGSAIQTEELPGGVFGVLFDVTGSYTVTVTATDGSLSTSETLTLATATRNRPPVLGSLRDDYTVELGLELALELTAVDPDGDVTTFFANLLQLPAGASLDATTGSLRFRPEAGQEGSYPLTLGVSDGALTDQATITINVVAGTASDTSVFGFVRDAIDFANGVDTPLTGMPVRLDGAALETSTDSDGRFAFGSLTAGRDKIRIDPDAVGGPGGYLPLERLITVTANQDRDLAPDFLLVPLNEGCAEVIAGQATALTGVLTGVEVTIPADTILAADGSAFTGEVCLGALPQQTPLQGFPTDTLACQVYGLSAPGAIFSSGASIVAPNYDNLPETTRLTLWQSTNGASFRRAANADVDVGAATVSSQSVQIASGSFFSFLPQAPRTVRSGDQATGNRQLSPFEGNLNEVYTLPGYFAFNRQQQVGLSYNSAAADPTIIVAGDVTVADDASLPVTLSTRINVRGLSIASDVRWTPREAASGTTPALVGQALSLRQSMPVDATGLASGRYPYDFIAQANYECSTVSAQHQANLYVQNETNSPYGTGWSIDGLQKLTQNPDGSVVIIDDDGIVVFNPQPTFTEFEDEPLVFPARGPQDIKVADIDLDGDLDVVFGNSGTGTINVLINNGDGTFTAQEPVQVADPNNVPATGTYAPNLASIDIGDLTQDGASDVAFALQLQTSVGYVENDGFGNLVEGNRFNSGRAALALTVADIDGDGLDDIITAQRGGGLVSRNEVYVNYGGPTLGDQILIALRSIFSLGVAPLEVFVADIDGDGLLDAGFRNRAGIYAVFNQGNRSFTALQTIVTINTSDTLGKYAQFADFNGNGRQDLVVSGTTNLAVYLNNDGRRFATTPIILQRPPTVSRSEPVFAIDANGDGVVDIILRNADGVSVYEGRGDGTFLPFRDGFLDYPLTTIAIADLNGDGSLDLVSTQRFTVTVHFSKPTESGEFRAAAGEFSQLSRLSDGSWERRYKDGMIVIFDATGLQTAEIDPQGNRRQFTYADGGRLAAVTDQVGGVTSFTYDTFGRMASTTYPDGRTTTFTYDDAAGTLDQVTEPTGSKVSFAYDEDGRLVSTTNQNGNSTAYRFDAVGQLSAATLPDGSNIAISIAKSLGLADGLGSTGPLFFVAPEDRVTTVTDRKGEITEIIVNEFGAPVHITDPLGRITRIIRDENNLVTRVERNSDVIPGGVRVDEITYDLRANVTLMTEAVGTPQERTTRYTYEPVFNRVLSMTDADGFTTSYAYDAFGEVTQITDPEGGVRQMVYNPEGKVTSRIDENGNETTFIYNANQNLAQMTYADGSISTMIYDARGNTTAVNEAVGTSIERQIQRTYDALNRVLTVEVTGADGVQIDGITQYSYFPAGNLATVTDETGLVTSMTYDRLERLVALDDPAEGLIQRTYNDAGEVTSHINGDGDIHQYAYDEVSRLIQTIDPEGFVKSFGYDSRNNVTSVTDGRGGVTTFGFDPLDRMTTRTNPIGQTMTRAYDRRDNLASLTREDGLTETALYDGLGRRTEVVTPDNRLTYAYDPRSNLTEAADNDSRVTFAYDERNRLISTTTDGTVGPQPEVTITYTYDELDRRLSMSDSLGGTTTYAYDVEDRLVDLTAPWGTVYSFGYDGEGRRTSLTSTSGRNTTYGYTNGLLTALSHVQSGVALTDLAYDYAVDGQLTAITDNLDPARSLAISYDDLNRLVQVARGAPGDVGLPVEDYAYDGEGNRTASHLSSLYASNAHNQLLEDARYTYAYDARGNRISRTDKATGAVETYNYDSQNRLIGYASDTTTASYAYDALDRRIAKTVDGVAEAFVYNPWDTYRSTSSDVVLDFVDGSLAKRWLRGTRVDEPLAFEAYSATTAGGSGEAYELYADRLGSILHVVDAAAGLIAADYGYDSFGVRNQSGVLEQRYGFTGREIDGETGLMYFRARHYDPMIGQFIQRDPIGFSGGDLNVYAYVGNNPQNFIDPTGLLKGHASFNLPGPSTAEHQVALKRDAAIRTGALVPIMGRVAALTAYTVGILDAIDLGLDLEEGLPDEEPMPSSQGSGGNHNHHCHPTAYGGADEKGNIVRISIVDHKRLHSLMQARFKQIIDDVTGRSMATSGRRDGASVIRDFGLDRIKEELEKFYADFPEFGC